jgi:ankyrin repeat protein
MQERQLQRDTKEPQKLKADILPSERPALPAEEQRQLNTKLLAAAASSEKDSEILRLVKAGADIAAKDNEGMTALHRAACRGRIQTCALLIREYAKAGRDVKELLVAQNSYGGTVVGQAAHHGYVKTMQFLHLMRWLVNETENRFLKSFGECVGG